MPNSVATLDQTPIIEWYMIWYGSKNIYQKDMRLKRLDYVLKDMITILGSIFSIIWRGGGHLYDHFNELVSFHIGNK